MSGRAHLNRSRRRPVLRNAGAVVCPVAVLLVLAGLLTGCSGGTVEVDPVPAGDLSAAEATACAELVAAVPDVVDGGERRPVEPQSRTTAAWGDPPIVLRCGVAEPADFDRFSSCQITNGVAWFIPEELITGRPEAIVMTTIGRSPGVQVRLPVESFPPANAMVNLAEAIKQTTRKVERCG